MVICTKLSENMVLFLTFFADQKSFFQLLLLSYPDSSFSHTIEDSF